MQTQPEPDTHGGIRETFLSQDWGRLLESCGIDPVNAEASTRRFANDVIRLMERNRSIQAWKLVRLADDLRKAQIAYMEKRGDSDLGRKVGEAAEAYDVARAHFQDATTTDSYDEDEPALTLGYDTDIDAVVITGPTKYGPDSILARGTDATPVRIFVHMLFGRELMKASEDVVNAHESEDRQKIETAVDRMNSIIRRAHALTN